MASNSVPQSMLYNSGYGSIANTYRDRSAEQQYSNSGQPMNPTYIPNFNSSMYGTQQPNLGRYQPPMLTNPYSGADQWQSGTGGYAYNLPTSFGPYGGAWGSPTSVQGPQSISGIQNAAGGSPLGTGTTSQPQFGGGLQTGAGAPSATGYIPQMAYNGFGAFGQAQQMQAPSPPAQPQLTAYQTALQQAQSNPAWQARAQAQMAASAGAAPSAGSAPANGWIPNFSAPYGQSPFAGIIAGMRQPPVTTQPLPTPTMS